MQTDELRDCLNANRQTLRTDILNGNYKPQHGAQDRDTQATGRTRMLGILTVTDRLLRQAIAHWPKPKE